MRLPSPIKKIADELAELPGIGPRHAIRLAFHLIDQGKEYLDALAKNISELKEIEICPRCYFIHQNGGGLCEICSNSNRDQKLILILEKETDLISIENTGKYQGRYLLLGPIPKTGLLADWQKERLASLKKFIEAEMKGKADEIILGMNPTSVGDFHANMLQKELGSYSKKISRLGRGLPTGGEIEFADEETLGASLERRG